jgi:hypothetical protein
MLFRWHPDQSLSMESRRFFALMEAGRKIRASERIEQCSIQALSGVDNKYFEELTGFYRRQIVKEEIPARAALPKDKGIDGEQAKSAVLSMFRR